MSQVATTVGRTTNKRIKRGMLGKESNRWIEGDSERGGEKLSCKGEVASERMGGRKGGKNLWEELNRPDVQVGGSTDWMQVFLSTMVSARISFEKPRQRFWAATSNRGW